MLRSIISRIASFLIVLLAIQGTYPTLAAELSQTLNLSHEGDHKKLKSPVAGTGDEYKIIWHIDAGAAVISAAAGVGIVINGIMSNFFAWFNNQPNQDKICGKSKTISTMGEDGVRYKYYVYSYTTGNHCDTTQRAKTITNALSDAFDEIHEDGASAVCIDLDHHGTWHGVLGLVTEDSGQDPQRACADHHAGAKRGTLTAGPNSPHIEGMNSTKIDEMTLVKRTGFPISQISKKRGKTTFSAPNKSQAVIMDLAYEIYQKSVDKSCDPKEGRLIEFDGVTYQYFYRASGRNCDTTAQIKTIVSAIDDAWDGMDKLSAVCMTLSHGGTWRGHLGVSAMQGDFPAQDLC